MLTTPLPAEPPSRSIHLYKSRCSELEREVVAQHAALAAQRLELESLRAKIGVLTECYRQIDEELGYGEEEEEGVRGAGVDGGSGADAAAVRPSYLRMVLRCAALQEEVERLREGGGTQTKRGEEGAGGGGGGGAAMAAEMLPLLRAACRQLQDARQFGSKLHVRLATGGFMKE